MPFDRLGAKLTAAKGLVGVFTGEGKGKTSAALGVLLRSVGHGRRVCIIFFMKGEYPYGEQEVLSRLPNVTMVRTGQLTFVDPCHITEEERREAQRALEAARQALTQGYDLVILDEVNLAAAWGLIEVEEVVRLIEAKPPQVDLILTGRSAPHPLLERADWVTDMVEVKHHYRLGLLSKKGIDY